MALPKLDSMVYWVRSVGSGGKDRVPMYFKGLCRRADEGWIGRDWRVRPVALGPGEYTSTVAAGDCEVE